MALVKTGRRSPTGWALAALAVLVWRAYRDRNAPPAPWAPQLVVRRTVVEVEDQLAPARGCLFGLLLSLPLWLLALVVVWAVVWR